MQRTAVFYHGTTRVRAQQIADAAAFAPHRTFLALGNTNRDLAEIFAQRTATRYPAEGGPALVLITMEEAAFERLRKQGVLRLFPFDPEDRPELRNRSQWILEAGGVPRFNQDADDWNWEPL